MKTPGWLTEHRGELSKQDWHHWPRNQSQGVPGGVKDLLLVSCLSCLWVDFLYFHRELHEQL